MRPSAFLIPDVLQNVEHGAAICVLASGSAGNCSVLVFRRGSIVRCVLIDLGLSPRRTMRTLAAMGIRPDQIDDAFVTHLDADHFQPSFLATLPPHVRVRMHERHRCELEGRGCGVWAGRVHGFGDDALEIDEGVTVRSHIMTHDDQGVATLRIDMPGLSAGTLGFCTDLGHVTPALVAHLRADFAIGDAESASGGGGGVDVLAMESNYCPRMQQDSDRPWFLKQRIMGGRGHLSNHEALAAVRAIEPREHVILLHLSRECNDPALVADLHAGSDYTLTIADQHRPTRWVRIARNERPLSRPQPPHVRSRVATTATLWSIA